MVVGGGGRSEDEGPGGGARDGVGFQVLPGLLCHDQLVLRLAVDHRLPVLPLLGGERESGGSNGPGTQTSDWLVFVCVCLCVREWQDMILEPR